MILLGPIATLERASALPKPPPPSFLPPPQPPGGPPAPPHQPPKKKKNPQPPPPQKKVPAHCRHALRAAKSNPQPNTKWSPPLKLPATQTPIPVAFDPSASFCYFAKTFPRALCTKSRRSLLQGSRRQNFRKKFSRIHSMRCIVRTRIYATW